ncbi:hypothetical protein BSLG_003685 [Batrachochytrium salamandrivorans]|nr:hypothetical protein BSLG_003685 [Batrachochytrium salamandrivorans]
MDYFIGWCVTCEKRIAPEYIYCSQGCQYDDFLIKEREQTTVSDISSHALTCSLATPRSVPLSLSKSRSSTSLSSCSSISTAATSAYGGEPISLGGSHAQPAKPTPRSVSRLEEWIVSDDSSHHIFGDLPAVCTTDAALSVSMGSSVRGAFTGTTKQHHHHSRSRGKPPPSPPSLYSYNGTTHGWCSYATESNEKLTACSSSTEDCSSYNSSWFDSG